MAAGAAAPDADGSAEERRARPSRPIPRRSTRNFDAATFRAAGEYWISTLGPADPVPVDEEMEYPIPADLRNGSDARRHLSLYLVILLLAATIYVDCMVCGQRRQIAVHESTADEFGGCSEFTYGATEVLSRAQHLHRKEIGSICTASQSTYC